MFPSIRRLLIWARRNEQAEALARAVSLAGLNITIMPDLPAAAAEADIISTATMARDPVLKGDWIHPSAHVNLIGALKANMREADDALISSASLFVDFAGLWRLSGFWSQSRSCLAFLADPF